MLDSLEGLFSSAHHVPLKDLSQSCSIRGQFLLPPPLGSVPLTLILWPTCHSYTRQPSVELHGIGSPADTRRNHENTDSHTQVRQAEPGEFTLRAFLAGRIDLTQAEAVIGVIDAKSDKEMKVGLRQLSGGLATPLETMQQGLLNGLAHIEAGLDFVEDDIEFIFERGNPQAIGRCHPASVRYRATDRPTPS